MLLPAFHENHAKDVLAFWQKCGLTWPWSESNRNIALRQTDKNGGFLVRHEAGRLGATIMVGDDGHRGTINYLALYPQF